MNYQKNIKKWGALMLLTASLFLFGLYILDKKKPNPSAPAIRVAEKEVAEEPPKQVAEIPPETLNLNVPYTVQAPFANWSVHEESCEEAALMMYERFLRRQNQDILPAEADRVFRAMKTWQVSNYGQEPDLSITALGELGRSYYSLEPKIIPFTEEEIKRTLISGSPVLIPVMTHSLKNPNYGRQNSYHILLIKGYNAQGFITNDAGIKSGKNHIYSWSTLKGAAEDQKISPIEALVLKPKT